MYIYLVSNFATIQYTPKNIPRQTNKGSDNGVEHIRSTQLSNVFYF